MDRRDDRPASVTDEYWGAVRHPNSDGRIWIVGHDRIGRATSPRIQLTTPDHRDLGPVHLVDQQQSIALDTQSGRDRLPLLLILAELQVADRKEVWRESRQRFAFECGAPRRLRPLEATARLRKLHDHYWNRARRD
jgi:hypothetical protein